MTAPFVVDLTGSDEDDHSPSNNPRTLISSKIGKTSKQHSMNSRSPQAQIKRVKPLNASSPSTRLPDGSGDRSHKKLSSQSDNGDKPAKGSNSRALAQSMVGGTMRASRAVDRPPLDLEKHGKGTEGKSAARSTAQVATEPPAQPRKQPVHTTLGPPSSAAGSQAVSTNKKRPFDLDGYHAGSESPGKKLKSAPDERKQPGQAARTRNHLSSSTTKMKSKSSSARDVVDLRSSPIRHPRTSSEMASTKSSAGRNETKVSERSPLKSMPAARDKADPTNSAPSSGPSRGRSQYHSRERDLAVPESPLDSPEQSRAASSPVKRPAHAELARSGMAQAGETKAGTPRQSPKKSNGRAETREGRETSTERASTASQSHLDSKANTPLGDPRHRSPLKLADRRDPQQETSSARSFRPITKQRHEAAPTSVEGPDDLLNSKEARGSSLTSESLQMQSKLRVEAMSQLVSPTKKGQRTVEKPPSSLSTSARVANVIENAVEELRDDHEYWNRTLLKRACYSSESRSLKHNTSKPTSVFKNMKPLEMTLAPDRKTLSESSVRMQVESMTGKSVKTAYAVPCSVYRTRDDADVPNYSHYVSIKHNFLANSERTMQHWPYFDDDFAISDALEVYFHVDVNNRERKLIRLAQAESIAAYVEEALEQVGCSWSDILHLFLEHSPNVGTDRDAQAALSRRETFFAEDFTRGDKRWTLVLSQLPPAQPANVAKAALLCDHFQQIAKFPLWHVARRSEYTVKLLQEKRDQPDMNELTCRICMRFHCPYHGELVEHSSSEDELPKDDEDIVQTDIIHPPRINHRSRVAFPRSVDEGEPNVLVKDRRAAATWLTTSAHLQNTPEVRGPFYPCHHPGESCNDAKCSCFVAKISCEKICSCPRSCQRKFQGCLCSIEKRGPGGVKKGQRLVCFEDARCACFQSGRECDPDLCNDCGVCDVLDPVHRHDDRVLQGRCRNASIQRGVPKHTILGDSRVHGLGLYACEDIYHHEYVGEYKGEIITKAEADRRGSVYEHQKLSYLFSLNREQEIDSTYFGTKIRFINHAGEGKGNNLYPRIIMVNTVYRIALYGARNIRSGEELFFDYGPMFPDEQLGGRERKAAPHVRNSNLVREFLEVVESEDEHGNRRARKAITNKRGKSATASRGQRHEEYNTGQHPRKSGTGALKSASGAASSRKRRGNGEDTFDDAQFDDVVDDAFDAGRRLYDYNIAEEDRVRHVEDDAMDEDDDFEPENSSERSRDGGSESDGEEEDDEDGNVGHRRQRGRPRRF